MRRTYGLLGAALCLAGMVFVAATGGGPWWIALLAVLAVIGLADAAVMSRRLGKERRG